MSEKKQNIRLLLVDDEEEFLASAAPALEKRGLEVVTARDGVEALKMVEEQPFDVIVLDVKMPGIDGAEVSRRLRREHQDLPIIILTGHGSVPQAFEASKRGVYDYLAKPCDMNVLAKKINEAAKTHPIEPDEKTISGKGVDIASISVLIADDEPELLASLKTVLERRKMIVLTAQSGAEALSTLSSTVVDIVVLDIKMPGMDGIEVLRRIKSDYPLVEVILLTGHPTVENALQGVKLGAIEYLMKPPDVDDLTKLIRKAYQRRQEELERSRREAINNILKKHPE